MISVDKWSTRKRLSPIMWAMLILLTPFTSWTTEELGYQVLANINDIEIRAYKAHQLATVNIESGFTRAGYSAFRYLFDYISGKNGQGKKIAMTAPVLQSPTEKGWAVSFVMPESESSKGMPEPSSKQVIGQQVQPALMAAIQYSGSWRKSRFLNHKQELVNGITKTNYEICGPITWARYNAPFSLPFMRRNEVLAKVCAKNLNVNI